ncbi:hypothetical protein BDR26DRAFT_214661 [Obelidium mucronatum]|nr:hypothetical protein BDR26DRAFT_214661 [Obelidium mucronatum]
MLLPLLPLLILCLSLSTSPVNAYKVPGLLAPNTTAPAVRTRYDYRQSFKPPYFDHGDKTRVPYFELSATVVPTDSFLRLTSSQARGAVRATTENFHGEWTAALRVATSGRGHVVFEYGGALLELGAGGIDAFVITAGEKRRVGGCALAAASREKAVRIKYIGNTLAVEADFVSASVYVPCFSASHIDLPKGSHFAFSAANDPHIYDDHDIISFEVFEVNPKPRVDNTEEYKIDDATLREIEKVDELVDHIRHEEEESQRQQQQGLATAAMSPQTLTDIRQTQSLILETLRLIESRVDVSSSSSNNDDRALSQASKDAIDQTMARMLAPMDRKVAEMKSTIVELESQLVGLNKNIQGLYEALRDFEKNGNTHMTNIVQAIGVSHEKIDKTHRVVSNGTKHHYFTYLVCLTVGGIMVYVGRVIYKLRIRDRRPKKYI